MLRPTCDQDGNTTQAHVELVMAPRSFPDHRKQRTRAHPARVVSQ